MRKLHKYTFVEPDGNQVAASRHRNPDGTMGGWVANNSIVDASAYIDPGAVVEPRAIVPPGSHVVSGRIVAFNTKFLG